jgi:DNA polymerase (family 10)
MAVQLDNAAVAERLEAFAGLLDLAGASGYTSRAYRRAAETIRETRAPILELARQGRAQELRGIGPGIAGRLHELAETGTIAELDELRREVRPELVGFGRMLGLSPRRTIEIANALGVETTDEFRRAATEGRLRTAPGVGPVTEAKLLERLHAQVDRPARGLTLNRARPLVVEIAAALGGEIAGDPRRWAETSFDLAVVVPTTDRDAAVSAFGELPQIVALVERGEDRATGVTVEGVPVVLHLPSPGAFGAELVRRTGSQSYVEALGPLPDAPDETAVYVALGIPWCPPELREAPYDGEPPALVVPAEIRGDLHSHTTWSDGRASVRDMALAARERGYEYLAICDHTENVRVVPGLDADAVRRQGEEIDAANEELAPFRILRGIEVDIRRDGTLDLPDDVLGELDWVQLSLHAGQREERTALTAKVAEAMRHPAVRCLSHPKGRIINHRPPNALDLEEVFAVAVDHGVALEVNGLPDRLDLSGEDARLAVEAGVQLVVSTDAHSVRGLGNMQLAVATARRGWATAANVLNTRRLDEVLAYRRR